MSQAQARQTLKTWADAGAKTEDELRQLLVQRSMKPVSTLAAQVCVCVRARCARADWSRASGQVQRSARPHARKHPPHKAPSAQPPIRPSTQL